MRREILIPVPIELLHRLLKSWIRLRNATGSDDPEDPYVMRDLDEVLAAFEEYLNVG